MSLGNILLETFPKKMYYLDILGQDSFYKIFPGGNHFEICKNVLVNVVLFELSQNSRLDSRAESIP